MFMDILVYVLCIVIAVLAYLVFLLMLDSFFGHSDNHSSVFLYTLTPQGILSVWVIASVSIPKLLQGLFPYWLHRAGFILSVTCWLCWLSYVAVRRLRNRKQAN
jgi:hypothetical protein